MAATAALLSFLLRFWRCKDPLRLASMASIDFFKVVVGVVGDDGRFDG